MTLPTDQPRYALTIGGKVYGPYALQQMTAYISEGRVTPASIVSRDGGAWIAAADDATLGAVFAVNAPAAPRPAPVATHEGTLARPQPLQVNARDAFLKELEGVRNRERPAFATQPAADLKPAPTARAVEIAPAPISGEKAAGVAVNLIIIYEIKSRSQTRLEEDIMALGAATQIQQGVWVVNGPHSSGAVRNELLRHFGKQDHLMVIDASRDKLAWFNFGPELDAAVRRIWRRA